LAIAEGIWSTRLATARPGKSAESRPSGGQIQSRVAGRAGRQLAGLVQRPHGPARCCRPANEQTGGDRSRSSGLLSPCLRPLRTALAAAGKTASAGRSGGCLGLSWAMRPACWPVLSLLERRSSMALKVGARRQHSGAHAGAGVGVATRPTRRGLSGVAARALAPPQQDRAPARPLRCREGVASRGRVANPAWGGFRRFRQPAPAARPFDPAPGPCVGGDDLGGARHAATGSSFVARCGWVVVVGVAPEKGGVVGQKLGWVGCHPQLRPLSGRGTGGKSVPRPSRGEVEAPGAPSCALGPGRSGPRRVGAPKTEAKPPRKNTPCGHRLQSKEGRMDRGRGEPFSRTRSIAPDGL